MDAELADRDLVGARTDSEPSSSRTVVAPASSRAVLSARARRADPDITLELCARSWSIGSAHQAAPADDDDLVCGERHLAHEVARDEDRPALTGKAPQEVAHPTIPSGSSPLTGSSNSITSGCRARLRHAEPLAHAEGNFPARWRATAESPTTSSTSSTRLSPMCSTRRASEGVPGRCDRVDRLCLQQRAHLVQSQGSRVMPSVHRHVTGVRCVETHDHAHGRRLACAVGAEESRHDAGRTLKLSWFTASFEP